MFSTLLLATAVFTKVSLADWKSVYTDTKKDCVVVSSSTDKAPIDFYESECSSYGGYQLGISGGDIRYSPTISFHGQEIHWGRPGAFHDMASEKIEWIYELKRDEEGSGQLQWKGLVFRLSIADPEGIKPDSKVLYALRLDGENTCVLGNPKTNEEARALVKNPNARCQTL